MLALLQMEKKIQRLLFAVLFFASTLVYGQSKPTDPDMSIKNSFYKKFKR
jgi:hypothetical protein